MMAGLSEERLRVMAIIHALKAVGIRVKNWKNFVNGDLNSEHTFNQDTVHFAFGRDLHLLPQHHVSEMGGTVPQFLVEACEYLSRHLSTEGLFRKTGSLSRIRALRADLEHGKPVFLPPHADLFQPCDIASLIKQFLRELPSPLIPADLQSPLIQAQGLDQEGGRNRTTLLITALLPSSHARALRYLCTFLRQAAERCSENRMDASSLAVVVAPNLLECPAQPCKLTADTEKHLDQQAAVIKSLILHADRIGVVPSCVMEASGAARTAETPSPAGGAMFSKRTGLSVYRSLRRQRRRSVGEIFVDAFSRLKPCRTPTGPPISLSVTSDPPLSRSPTPQSPITVKRKASEETLPELEGSAKKRRSLHDLREDTPSSIREPTDTGYSPLEEKGCREEPISTTSKRRNQMREHRKSLRPPGQEEKAHRRKRSLRFFTVSGGGSNSNHVSTTTPYKDPEDCLEDHRIQPECEKGSPCTTADVSPRIPFILIDGPGGVVIGNEVDDDPELLNCSFAESPNDCLNVGSKASCIQRQDSEEPCEDEGWTLLEDENFEQLRQCEVIEDVTQNEGSLHKKNAEVEKETKRVEEQPPKVTKVKSNSKNRSRPRRSISLPEVTIESCSDEVPELEKDVGRDATELDNSVWPMFASLTLSNEHKYVEGQETKRNVKILKNAKQEKVTDWNLGFKRPHQRLSMAERLRGFTALTMLLRTSRAAPQLRDKPQEGLQRGATRLRRQGARRFGRSISHEGVSERPVGQSPESSPPANQAFIGIYDTSPDSGVESVDHEPVNDLHHQEEVCRVQRSQNFPQAQPNDVNVNCFPTSSEKDQYPKSETIKKRFQFLSKRSTHLIKSTLDVEESNLHKLLDQKCMIDGQKEEDHQDSSVHFLPSLEQEAITPDPASPMFCQQMAQLNPFEDTSSTEDLKADQLSPLLNKETPSWLDASPPFEFPPCKAFSSLTLDGVISEDDASERFDPCDLSPPPFQFSRLTARRRYRDSPRWPSHEVRMSAWNPLPL